jgi:anti-sigma B factor antagonist
VIMIPVGQLDRTAVRELPKLLEPALAKDKPRIALDLSKADRVDASGLAILVTWMKKTRQSGGDMLIINPSPNAQRALRRTGLEGVFLAGP